MIELLVAGGVLALALPLVFCVVMAYLLFCALSAILKAVGFVAGGAITVVVCLIALVGAFLFAVVGLPFFLLF